MCKDIFDSNCNVIAVILLCVVGMHVIPQDMTSFVTWFIYAVGMGIISVFVIVGINYMMEPKEFKELILRVKGIVRR